MQESTRREFKELNFDRTLDSMEGISLRDKLKSTKPGDSKVVKPKTPTKRKLKEKSSNKRRKLEEDESEEVDLEEEFASKKRKYSQNQVKDKKDAVKRYNLRERKK